MFAPWMCGNVQIKGKQLPQLELTWMLIFGLLRAMAARLMRVAIWKEQRSVIKIKPSLYNMKRNGADPGITELLVSLTCEGTVLKGLSEYYGSTVCLTDFVICRAS